MSKKRYTEFEIQKILQEYKTGTSIHQIVEKYGISQATFYNWKTRYGDQSLTDIIIKLNRLKEDHDRLKKMFADLSLENLSLKAQLEKFNHH